MKSFIKAFKEYHYCLTIKGTKPKICYSEKRGFECVWFFSESTIKKIGFEVIL